MSRDEMIYKQFFQLIPSSQFQSQAKNDGISPHLRCMVIESHSMCDWKSYRISQLVLQEMPYYS